MSSKEIFYQGLAELDVLIEDTSLASPNYFRILKMPSELTLGINTFRFSGNADLFPENTPIYVEILDYNGNPVYYETSIDTDSYENIAIVSIYVTDQTTPGTGTVIICSTAKKSAKGDILDTSKINVRWKHSISINTNKRNETGRYLFHTYPQTLYTNTLTTTSTLQQCSASAASTVTAVLNSGSFNNSYVSWSLAVNHPMYVLPFGLSTENGIIIYTSAIARKDNSASSTDRNLALLIRITAWLPQTGSIDFDTFGVPVTGSADYFLGGVSGSIASGSTVLGARSILTSTDTLDGTIRVSGNVKSIIYLPDYVQGKIIYVRVEYAPFLLPYSSKSNGNHFYFSLRLGNIIGIIGSSPQTALETSVASTGTGFNPGSATIAGSISYLEPPLAPPDI